MANSNQATSLSPVTPLKDDPVALTTLNLSAHTRHLKRMLHPGLVNLISPLHEVQKQILVE